MGGGRVLTPAGRRLGTTTGEATLLVQAAQLCAGLATLLQTVGIGPVGSRLPLRWARASRSSPSRCRWPRSNSGIVVGAVVAVVLNLVLPGRRVQPASAAQ